MATYDAIVMGAGSTGEVLAGKLAEGGWSVAICEEHLVGGECSYYACMPSKALLRPPELTAETRRTRGVRDTEVEVAETLERRDEVIHHLDDSSQLPWLEERGIDLLRGTAALTGERRVTIDGAEHEARRAVIVATGSLTAMPPIEGLDQVTPWTNREATTAKAPPERLVVIGGGAVGSELAYAWQSLGSQVVLVEGERHLMPNEEIFACEQVTESLQALGVDIRLGQKAERIWREDGAVRAELTDGSVAEGDELLLAAGRRARVGDIGLDVAGLPQDQAMDTDWLGRIEGVDWLYAIGDVNGRAPWTHMGKHQGRMLAELLLDGTPPEAPPFAADGRLSPRVTFTDPQVAAVGHTMRTVERDGLDPIVIDTPTGGNAGGSFIGKGADGTTRFLVDREKGTLIGATFVGPEVAEALHAATIAIVAQVPVELLRFAVPAFPTRSEVWLQLTEGYRRQR